MFINILTYISTIYRVCNFLNQRLSDFFPSFFIEISFGNHIIHKFCSRTIYIPLYISKILQKFLEQHPHI